MISLSLKNILIISVTLVFIYLFFIKDTNTNNTIDITNSNNHNEQTYNSSIEPQISTQLDTFWTNILQVDNEDSKVYQYQLPNYFNVNPKYLMYHPNFSMNANKTVQIISDNEPEAVAMLNLWVALNKGLLDSEENFSKLFETSIRRSKKYPAVFHKFKSDINNMVYFQNDINETIPDNLEFTEDLALNEVLLSNQPDKIEKHYDSVNTYTNVMAPI
ncbi:hypothetical protein crov496 [Cafeteria roenbergensis virus]|uniref:Uncharacterized protein n=1 Tax=Cafeteria roenbergensis virus (strain BV-PW1) TaxID=693272 RepID=E3T5R7_CROVB|nr:hypothetical protein crov496 [Cafeteria roenbergensis virus BV-PW1]ADO67530.1 hypothetical protein crov496 [Cafeteria roenbergensis virus BV-PW1]